MATRLQTVLRVSSDEPHDLNPDSDLPRKIRPGGWIEQIEAGPFITSDDGSLPPNSALAHWSRYMVESGARAGRHCDIILTMASDIEKAGFVDIHEKTYKWPIGPWAREKL